MAGYIFNLNSVRSLEQYIENGIYATKLSSPKNGRWLVHHEGTFADYATMKPGDNIYFFIQRNIYGIGHLVEVAGDCKFLNFPRASQPAVFDYEDIQPHLLWDEGQESVNQRWLCLFQPSPYFLKTVLTWTMCWLPTRAVSECCGPFGSYLLSKLMMTKTRL
ncbi:MAG: hypothetical protein RQM92_12150 [Candidatus Syntrophopropionicum ammoniitolerans]